MILKKCSEKSTQTNLSKKENELIATKKSFIKNRKDSLLHTAIISIRQDLFVGIQQQKVDINVNHIEIDDVGLKQLPEIGGLISKFANRKKPNYNLISATVQSSQLHVSERDSKVNVSIDAQNKIIDIEASNLFIQLTSSFLANIGPFAEFDLVPPNKKNNIRHNHASGSTSGTLDTSNLTTISDNHSREQESNSEEKDDQEEEIPEINITAKCINFTIEPDDLPKHIQSLANTQPFTINIPNKSVECSFKVFDGKLDLLKLHQHEGSSGTPLGGPLLRSHSLRGLLGSSQPMANGQSPIASTISIKDTIREENHIYERELLISKLQENEGKLIENLNDQSQKLEQMTIQNISLKNQVDMLEQQLKKSKSDKDEYQRNFENLLRQHLDIVKK